MVNALRTALPALMLAACAHAAPAPFSPHVGYLYPAGGRQGATFEIMAGGQFLRGVNSVHITGEGVQAKVVQHAGPLNNEQRIEARRYIAMLIRNKLAGMPGASARMPRETHELLRRLENPGPTATNLPPPKLPRHPTLRNIDGKSLPELRRIAVELSGPNRNPQGRMQMSDLVVLEITVAPDAPPGMRELRLGTPAGMTNPLRFDVGLLPEVLEQEPNERISLLVPSARDDRRAARQARPPAPLLDAMLPMPPPVQLPATINGQIMPGDTDCFTFHARKGQQLVMDAQARRLRPYLADAVPGWFQATLALYDTNGNEMAFTDDYRLQPDPVMLFNVPADGEYRIEIRDAIYRGREDFVYRISVSEQPFITKMFPLGGCAGSPAIVTISGWNLPGERVTLDTRAGRGHIRETAWRKGSLLANRLPYTVDTLPECAEAETNDTTQTAQNIALPVILNGRIGHAGDIDVFAFHARTGERVVAEVRARRLFSPLDSLVRLTDASGRVLAWNDDFEDKGMGLDTHHADSYISTNLPATGMYFIHVADSQHHGGDAYAYRLRISPPRPGFELRMAPSSINAAAGRAVPISVFAMRKDGFDGGIDIVLTNAPDGFTLSGARIPPGRDSVRMTLMAPGGATSGVTRLELEGCARIGSETVSAPVVPAEDMMQAFAYRHLVPSEQLLVCVTRGGRPGGPPIEVASAMPVQVPVGGAAPVQLRAPRGPLPRGLQFELSDPPKGVALSNVVTATGAASFMLLVETNTVPAGYADNLIVEAYYDGDTRRPGARPQRQRQRMPASILPAIPIEIVRPQ